jgi:hypothetical protein
LANRTGDSHMEIFLFSPPHPLWIVKKAKPRASTFTLVGESRRPARSQACICMRCVNKRPWQRNYPPPEAILLPCGRMPKLSSVAPSSQYPAIAPLHRRRMIELASPAMHAGQRRRLQPPTEERSSPELERLKRSVRSPIGTWWVTSAKRCGTTAWLASAKGPGS